MSYFILSLDGGGIRGVLTAKLIERLEASCPFLDRVELMAGTSTGGILALGLSRGLDPSTLVELYRGDAARIFGHRDALDAMVGSADELFRADYDNEKGLRQALMAHFGTSRLKELQKKVLIPTFDLSGMLPGASQEQWKPKFLHNFDTPGNDGDVLALDAALRTSAAPTYFPSYQGYIDGGVVANNPSMCAVAKAVKAGIAFEDIVVLSIGTGQSPERIPDERHDWGLSQWSRRIVPLVLGGGVGIADYQCAELLGERYMRLDVALEEPIALDAIERVPDMIDMAEAAPLVAVERFIRTWIPERESRFSLVSS